MISSYDMDYFAVTSGGNIQTNHFTNRVMIKQDDTQTRPAFETSVTTEDSMLSADLKDSVAFEIGYSVPEVQAVFTKFKENGVLHVWAVVPGHDRRVYRSIYAKERQIIRQFRGVDFDFNVVPSHGREPHSLISDPEIELAYLRK